MSLNDSWQTGRVQRQQELALRHEEVQQVLSEFQQTRQAVAAQLHSDLSLFREELMQQEQHRKASVQAFRDDLQAYYQTVQADVQALLAATRDRRQIQAQALAAELASFVAGLRKETQTVLATMTVDRAAMAQQLAQDLRTFHGALQTSVRSLRTQLQAEVADRQATVQEYLTDCGQWRIQQAEAVQQRLQTTRLARATELDDLFQQLAIAKQERHDYCQSLRETVWGTDGAIAPPAPTPTAVRSIPPKTTPAKAPSTRSSVPANMTAPKLTTKSPIKRIPATAKPVANAPKEGKANGGSSTGTSPTGTSPTGTSPTGTSPTGTTPAPTVPEVAYEKEVYTFLHTNNGARLTQIETGLGINRFQAVDALRSLIKKGLVTQRDRVYRIQEALANA